MDIVELKSKYEMAQRQLHEQQGMLKAVEEKLVDEYGSVEQAEEELEKMEKELLKLAVDRRDVLKKLGENDEIEVDERVHTAASCHRNI